MSNEEMERAKIGVIISTIREGRFGEKPAQWIADRASGRSDLDLEIIDMRDYQLPFYGAADDASMETVARWQAKLESLDGYIFITAEYNHSITGVLKNAIEWIGSQCARKPAAFIAYGGVGGARAVQQLRLICVELQMAALRTAVHISRDAYVGAMREGKALADFEILNNGAEAMLNDLAWWAHTLKQGRLLASEVNR